MGAMRLGKAVSKAGAVCMEVRDRVNAAGARFPSVYDQIDMVVGAAHQNATKAEIESMTISLDEAITEAEIISREVQAVVLLLREVRGRLDRAMQSYRAAENARPVAPTPPVPSWVAAPVPTPTRGNPPPAPLPVPRSGTFEPPVPSTPTRELPTLSRSEVSDDDGGDDEPRDVSGTRF